MYIVAGVFGSNLCEAYKHGFLGKMVTKAVVKKIEDTAIYHVVREAENSRSIDVLVNNSTARYILFVKKRVFLSKKLLSSTMNQITKSIL